MAVREPLLTGVQGVEQTGDAHVGAGMDQGAHHFLFRAPSPEGPRRMALHLYLRPAQSGQKHHRQQLPGLLVQPGAGIEVAEAVLGEKAWDRLIEGLPSASSSRG